MSSNSIGDSMVLIWSENMGIEYELGESKAVAVKKADIRIIKGEYVAVTGLFGAARNSFINVIGCLNKPSDGKYVFDYDDVALLDRRELSDIRKNKIGFVFPNYNLFNEYSILQNIEFPLNYSSLKKLEKKALVEKAVGKLGLEDMANVKVGALTEFQKQKVALARAIVNDPLLLISCEPASNVQQSEAAELMELLNSLNRDGLSVVLTSDNQQIATCAPREIKFKDGQIISDNCISMVSLGKEVCAVCQE